MLDHSFKVIAGRPSFGCVLVQEQKVAQLYATVPSKGDDYIPVVDCSRMFNAVRQLGLVVQSFGGVDSESSIKFDVIAIAPEKTRITENSNLFPDPDRLTWAGRRDDCLAYMARREFGALQDVIKLVGEETQKTKEFWRDEEITRAVNWRMYSNPRGRWGR